MSTQVARKGWGSWAIACLFLLYELSMRTALGSFQVEVMRDLRLDHVMFSLLSSTVFLICYALLQLPVGALLDRWGVKRCLLLATLVSAGSAFGLAASAHLVSALLWRMGMGAGAAFGFVGVLVVVYDWFPVHRRGLWVGVSQFVGTVGPMVVAGPLGGWVASGILSWRVFFQGAGVGCLILAVLVALWVHDYHPAKGRYQVLKHPQPIALQCRQLLLRVQPWLVASVTACLYMVVEYLSENEGRHFLALKGMGSLADYALTLSWLGYALGCPLLGWASDALQRRRLVLRAVALLAVGVMVAMVTVRTPMWVLVVFFGVGVTAGGQSVGYALIAEHFKRSEVGVGLAFNNTLVILFPALGAPLLGRLFDYLGGGQAWTLASMQWGMGVFVGLAVVACGVTFWGLNETFAKSQVEWTWLKRG